MRTLFPVLIFLLAGAAFAQPKPRNTDSEPPRAAPRSLCDALAGAEHDRCVAEEARQREAQEQHQDRAPGQAPRSCDDLFGPEKEVCLKQGGRVRAGVEGAAAGSTAPR